MGRIATETRGKEGHIHLLAWTCWCKKWIIRLFGKPKAESTSLKMLTYIRPWKSTYTWMILTCKSLSRMREQQIKMCGACKENNRCDEILDHHRTVTVSHQLLRLASNPSEFTFNTCLVLVAVQSMLTYILFWLLSSQCPLSEVAIPVGTGFFFFTELWGRGGTFSWLPQPKRQGEGQAFLSEPTIFWATSPWWGQTVFGGKNLCFGS